MTLDHDRCYRDRNDLRPEERALNYDHRDALETDLLVRPVHELKAGRAVEVPVYDFRRAIIVEGHLVFVAAALRGTGK